LNEESNNPEL